MLSKRLFGGEAGRFHILLKESKNDRPTDHGGLPTLCLFCLVPGQKWPSGGACPRSCVLYFLIRIMDREVHPFLELF